MAGMFDLTSLVPPEKLEAEPSTFSEEEKASLLGDYEQVPPHMWEKLPKGTHIRYENEGVFKRGAYIAYIGSSRKTGNKFIQLVVSIARKPNPATNPSWGVSLDKITAIWRKKTFGEQCKEENNSQLVADMKIMVNEVRILREKVLTLESNQRKLVALLKKSAR